MNELPRLMVITARERMKPQWIPVAKSTFDVGRGCLLVQWREHEPIQAENATFLRHFRFFCSGTGTKLVINNNAQLAREIRADGVHWPERALWNGGFQREGLQLCGASVHSVAAAQKAQELGADYVQYGHIFETFSHPG